MSKQQKFHFFSGKPLTDDEIEKKWVETKNTLEEIGFGKNGNTFEKIILPLFEVREFDKLTFDLNNEKHRIIRKVILSKERSSFTIGDIKYKYDKGHYSGYLDYCVDKNTMVKEQL